MSAAPIGVSDTADIEFIGKLVTPDGTREFLLKSGTNTVGRENADILLVHNTVSRSHAKIAVEQGRAYVEDSGSTNGTCVAGVKIASGEKTELTDGCEIVFGSFALKYQAPPISVEHENDVSCQQTDSDEPAVEDTPEESVQEVSVSHFGRLASKDGSCSFDIHDGTNTIGRRESDNDIVISDPYCSGRHADIASVDGKFTITDVGSTNGTFVNGVKLDANVSRDLNEGDEITLGRAVFTITQIKESFSCDPEGGSD